MSVLFNSTVHQIVVYLSAKFEEPNGKVPGKTMIKMDRKKDK